jgi:hypothetical protein
MRRTRLRARTRWEGVRDTLVTRPDRSLICFRKLYPAFYPFIAAGDLYVFRAPCSYVSGTDGHRTSFEAYAPSPRWRLAQVRLNLGASTDKSVTRNLSRSLLSSQLAAVVHPRREHVSLRNGISFTRALRDLSHGASPHTLKMQAPLSSR